MHLLRGNTKLSAKLFLTNATKRMAQTQALANMHINCIIIGNKEVSVGDTIL